MKKTKVRSIPEVIERPDRGGVVVLGLNCVDGPTAYPCRRIECVIHYFQAPAHRWIGDFAAVDKQHAFGLLADHFSGGAVQRIVVTDVEDLRK